MKLSAARRCFALVALCDAAGAGGVLRVDDALTVVNDRALADDAQEVADDALADDAQEVADDALADDALVNDDLESHTSGKLYVQVMWATGLPVKEKGLGNTAEYKVEIQVGKETETTKEAKGSYHIWNEWLEFSPGSQPNKFTLAIYEMEPFKKRDVEVDSVDLAIPEEATKNQVRQEHYDLKNGKAIMIKFAWVDYEYCTTHDHLYVCELVNDIEDKKKLQE